MIQFRWKKVEGFGQRLFTDTEGMNCAVVDGTPCILQYRMHFIPQVFDSPAIGEVITLAKARDVDAEWKDVLISWSDE